MKKFVLTALIVSLFATVACAETKGSEAIILQALASGRPTLVDFGAAFCVPCKRMKPILDSLKKEYAGKANVIFVDIKQERDIPSRYRIMIMPTQVFYDAAGKEVKRHLGFMDKPEIVAEFKALGVKMSFLENIEQIVAVYPVIAFGAVFLAGIISSASPCVLATIPLVVGYVGGYSDGDRKKAFLFSIAFIMGLSITFTAFGAAAGLLGTMFGMSGGWWYAALGAVAVAMGLQMVGVYQIRLPFHVEVKPKRRGIFGAFLLGLFFGIVSSPCATPVLVVILTLVASKGEIVYGTALLFVYAIGHCMLMLLAGTFTGFVEAFVKAKGVRNFSEWSKRIGGAIISLVGVYLLYQAF